MSHAKSNVLIEDDGRALISDIGIYTVVSQLEFTAANIAGSCRWTAPEVLDLPEEDVEKPISSVLTTETDVYAFGMTVLEVNFYTATSYLLLQTKLYTCVDLHRNQTILEQETRANCYS